jgi:[ribosomal protein S5]-alanine N-acetyltransferase
MELIAIGADGQPDALLDDPPSLVGEVCRAYATLYADKGFEPPWVGYLAMVDGLCVGSCGFKAPARGNRVEIAYLSFPGHEGKGHATRMARALTAIARSEDPAITLAARTLPEEGPSTAILRRLGFRFAGPGHDADDGAVWEWRLDPQSAFTDRHG